MNIEQHVPKLETCKRLQEAGWKRDTYFASYNEETIFEVRRGKTYYEGLIPRPLLSELLEEAYKKQVFIEITATRYAGALLYVATGYYYLDDDDTKYDRSKMHNNPAEAAAQLVLTLVEEGVLTL